MKYILITKQLTGLIIIFSVMGLAGCTPSKRDLMQKLKSQIKNGKFE